MVADPDVENISESGFSVSIPDGRELESFFEEGSIGNSGNVIYEGNYRPTESQRKALSGKTFDVFAKGRKIASTTVKNVGDYEINFSNSTGNVEGIQEVFPSIGDKTIEKFSDHPDLASSLQGVADAYSIRSLKFKKPVQKTKETVSKTQGSSLLVKAGLASAAALIILKVSS